MTDRFNGFLPQAPGFLERLAANNNKAWFDEHRDQYEELLLEPLKLLVGDLTETMRAIDPALITIPAVDKTISRIYRDTRFSRNKSPCRTCLWITFKRRSPDWKQAPCFFFELTADSYRYGMGFYSASRETMDNLQRWHQRKNVCLICVRLCRPFPVSTDMTLHLKPMFLPWQVRSLQCQRLCHGSDT